MEAKLEDLLSTAEVAKVLKTTIQTLANDRCTARKIPFTKIGRRVYYLRSDIERLLSSNYRPSLS